MAMTGAGLGAAIKTKMDALPAGADSDSIYVALGEAIIEYVEANAEVTVTDVTTGTDTAPGTID